MTAKLREWVELATETAKELKVAKADVLSQSGLREATRKGMDTQTAEVAVLQVQLTATNAEL